MLRGEGGQGEQVKVGCDPLHWPVAPQVHVRVSAAPEGGGDRVGALGGLEVTKILPRTPSHRPPWA